MDRFLSWNVKDSFRGYVAALEGAIETAEGATETADSFRFPLRASHEGGLEFDGAVSFSAHGGALAVRVASPRILFDPSGARLSIDRSRDSASAEDRVDIAAITPAGVDALLAGDGVPTALLAEGASLFDFIYPAGTELAAVRFTTGPA